LDFKTGWISIRPYLFSIRLRLQKFFRQHHKMLSTEVAPAESHVWLFIPRDQHFTSVSFNSEWLDASGQWFRSYGVQVFQYNETGHAERRFASPETLTITTVDCQLNK
jgi:nuclear transport factor 2 (NTF2) superfamily protein